MANAELVLLFFVQIAVILATCRVIGWVARKYMFQPQVVAEMVAGLLLGPSLLALLPAAWHDPLRDVQRALFPTQSASMSVLYVVSQIALVLYMFVVGLEFRTDLFRQRIRSAASVSIAGMVTPFVLGLLLAIWFYERGGLFGEGVRRTEAMLFLGAAMSLTAFPMLARIISECGIASTRLGTLTLAAGAIGDAAAWCVLAVVLASFESRPSIALIAIGGGVAYVLVTLLLGRRLLAPLGVVVEREGGLPPALLSPILLLLVLAALFTEWIGIHAVFGAFILGTAMPRGRLTAELTRTIEPLTTTFLLPVFFVYSGLNTRIDLVNSWELWGIAALVLATACLGKFAACCAAARLNGETPRDALAVGALMNTRGLMELIILNIGRERGLITAELFTVMVMMAVITTLMASPIFLLVYRGRAKPA